MKNKFRITVFIIILIIGLALIWNGVQYNLSRIGYAPNNPKPDSFFRVNMVDIGIVIVALAPLVIKKYLWTAIMIGLIMVYFAYGYFLA